jgi:oxaloacetate decarboxylase alpha subunit
MKEEAKQYVDGDSVEDILTYAMFPKVAPKFFEKRRDRQVGIDADHADKANKVHPV